MRTLLVLMLLPPLLVPAPASAQARPGEPDPAGAGPAPSAVGDGQHGTGEGPPLPAEATAVERAPAPGEGEGEGAPSAPVELPGDEDEDEEGPAGLEASADTSGPDAALDPADADVLDSLSRPDDALSPQAVRLHQKELLTAQLAEADREIADSSALLPTLAVGLGLAATVTGVAVGVSKAFRCGRAEEGCSANAAAGVLVVSGLAVSAAGFLWLYSTKDDQRILRSKRYQIAQKLEWVMVEEEAAAR